MKKRMKKLRLAKETLRNLSSGDLQGAVGGFSQTQHASECTDTCICPTRFCNLTCNCATDQCDVCTDHCTG